MAVVSNRLVWNPRIPGRRDFNSSIISILLQTSLDIHRVVYAQLYPNVDSVLRTTTITIFYSFYLYTYLNRRARAHDSSFQQHNTNRLHFLFPVSGMSPFYRLTASFTSSLQDLRGLPLLLYPKGLQSVTLAIRLSSPVLLTFPYNVNLSLQYN